MTRYKRVAVVVSLLFTFAAVVQGLYSLFAGGAGAARWLATAGLLATVNGVLQIDYSELFQRLIEHYTDEVKYPYGPPSHITREIIDNPERQFAMWLRRVLFFDPRTGLWLIIFGTLVQAAASWL